MSELSSSSAAPQKRTLDSTTEDVLSSSEVQLLAPSSKRQKADTDGAEEEKTAQKSPEDVEMTDSARQDQQDVSSEHATARGNGASILETSEQQQPEAAAEGSVGTPSSFPQQQKKAKRSESSRPRRNKKNRNDEDAGGAGGKNRQPRVRRRATKEEEEAALQRKAQEEALGIEKAPRYPKRQSALLVGFCGSGYSGMQIQPEGVKTIEGVLFKALVKAGAVSQDNADDPVKVNLGRAARTDAGVHAAGNVVSMKIIVTVPGVKDLVARINEELPPEIRLWGFVRTQNSFNARLVCDSRKYTYYFPSYLLIPPKPDSGLYKSLRRHERSESSVETAPIHPFWKDSADSSPEEDLARKRVWRVGSAEMERLREIVKKYEGSHNFHNFTVGREFGDRSNNRFMKEIRVADPVVYGETEWISVLFHGQSFMLHQIRKMMAASVLSCRTETSPQIFDELYKSRMVFVPKMPSLGLLLEEPLFNSYNSRITAANEKLNPTDADYRPPVDFDIHREQIEAFKDEFIYKNMRGIEDKTALFDAWMRSVDSYGGRDLLWLNRDGKLPSECVIVKGERRSNPFKEKRIFDTTSFPTSGLDKKKLLEEVADEDESEEEVIDKKCLAEMEG